MKLHILSPDFDGKIDGTIKAQILDNLPNQCDSLALCDCAIVPISFFAEYKFNKRLYELNNRPYVLVDFLEYSTFWDGKETHLLGKNLHVAKNLCDNTEWQKLDTWVRDNPPVMYFKRELLLKDEYDRVRPIEFLCYLDIPEPQSKAEFDARPFDVFSVWGYSHESRPRLHADIFRGMAAHGLGVISDWTHAYPYMQNPQSRTWVTIYSPYYVRKPMAEMLWWHERSKIMVSLPGAGGKCFRSAEVVNTVHALHQNKLAWSYPWIDGVNCIDLAVGNEFNCLDAALQWDKLYDIYVAGQENLRNYQPQNYIPNYLIPTIEGAL